MSGLAPRLMIEKKLFGVQPFSSDDQTCFPMIEWTFFSSAAISRAFFQLNFFSWIFSPLATNT
jgi:hypothetical protein